MLFRRAAVVVSNSAHMHRLAVTKGAHQAVRVSTPIPRDFLDTPVAPLQTPPTRILFVGRLAAEKRVDAIVDLAAAFPDRTVCIAGDGPLHDEVEAAAARLENLTYLGWLDRHALREALDASDLLILPSHVEAFGTVALEAMTRGRLTLVSPGCGIVDWPELAQGLRVMTPEETVTEAFRRLLNEPPRSLSECAATGRRQAVATARRCTDEWLALMRP
jgi:glycosyltransferase involved in cell wall biosynthesis